MVAPNDEGGSASARSLTVTVPASASISYAKSTCAELTYSAHSSANRRRCPSAWRCFTRHKDPNPLRTESLGQRHYNWTNLRGSHEDKLRRLYRAAVDAYEAKMSKDGITGQRAAPAFLTWSGFKAATGSGLAICVSTNIWKGFNLPLPKVKNQATQVQAPRV